MAGRSPSSLSGLSGLPLTMGLRWAGFGLAASTVFLALSWPTFTWMAQRFAAHDSFYSHGWLIPLASAWLIVRQRERLKLVVPRASYWGLALVGPCALVQVLATWWRIHVVSGFALVGLVWGLTWTLWGWRILWTLRLPMVLLLFMVPLPGHLLIAASFSMKLLAASLATSLLNLMSLPAVREGSTIHVTGLSVVVDDTCSGLRSLISLIALAVFWSALMPPSSTRWQKLAVVGSSIPIALVSNMVRILLLVLLGAIYGPRVADGFIHYGSGIVVFGIALMALAWVSRTVRQWQHA